MIHSFVTKLARLAKQALPLRRQARMVARLLPASQWYAAANRISNVQGTIARLTGKNGCLTRALILDYWLRELTLVGPFPIPWHSTDDPAVLHRQPGRAIFFCWTHVPLIEFALSTAVQMGVRPLMVCDPGMMVDRNKFVAPGLAERTDAIPARSTSLRRVLTELRAGHCVAWLTDPLMGGQISGQTLRLVKLSGARLAFVWGEREPDGTIAIRMMDPPFPDCENAAAIEANLEVMRRERRRILQTLGASDEPGAPPVKRPRRTAHGFREHFLHR